MRHLRSCLVLWNPSRQPGSCMHVLMQGAVYGQDSKRPNLPTTTPRPASQTSNLRPSPRQTLIRLLLTRRTTPGSIFPDISIDEQCRSQYFALRSPCGASTHPTVQSSLLRGSSRVLRCLVASSLMLLTWTARRNLTFRRSLIFRTKFLARTTFDD